MPRSIAGVRTSTMKRVANRHYGGSAHTPTTTGATVKAASNAALSPGSGDFTVALWYYYSLSYPLATRAVVQIASTTWTDGLLLYTRAADGVIDCQVIAGTQVMGPANLTPQAWHRIVVTGVASSKTLSVYIDGALANSSAGAWAGNFGASCAVGVGSVTNEFTNNDTDYADLTLDIGHAWTLAQVQADYFQGLSPATVTHRWPLNDGLGTTGTASVGGRNATASGGALFSSNSPMVGRGTARNVIALSNGLTGSPWSTSQVGAHPGATDPLGGTTATTWNDSVDGSPAGHILLQTPPPSVIGQTLITSVYFKPVARRFLGIAPNSGALNAIFGFDLLNIGSDTISLVNQGVTAGVETCREDPTWVRCWMKYKANQNPLRIYICDAINALSYTGNGTLAITTWGAMTEIAQPGQDSPSPYLAAGSTPLSVVGKREFRQNLTHLSEAWSNNTIGQLFNCSVVDAAVSDPLGTSLGSTITATAGAGLHYANDRAASYQSGTPYVFSVWLQRNNNDWAFITFPTDSQISYFNTNTGAMGSLGAGVSLVEIKAFGSGWYRVTLAATPGYTAATGGWGVGIANANGGANFTAAGTEKLNVFGRHVSIGTSVHAYIKTLGSPVSPSGAPRSFVT